MGREGRDYWEAQLSEYWDSGLTIQEYSELKELPYESTRRWIRVLQKARQDDASDSESLELVEVKSLQTDARNGSGIRLLVDGIGGAYVTVTGRVRHISVPEKTLVMEDGTVIGFEDIAAISGFQFEI